MLESSATQSTPTVHLRLYNGFSANVPFSYSEPSMTIKDVAWWVLMDYHLPACFHDLVRDERFQHIDLVSGIPVTRNSHRASIFLPNQSVLSLRTLITIKGTEVAINSDKHVVIDLAFCWDRVLLLKEKPFLPYPCAMRYKDILKEGFMMLQDVANRCKRLVRCSVPSICLTSKTLKYLHDVMLSTFSINGTSD